MRGKRDRRQRAGATVKETENAGSTAKDCRRGNVPERRADTEENPCGSRDRERAGTPGILHIVPTPVGNLEDMTFRAVRVLKEADLILAEDTRTSSVLLRHYDIHGHIESHHKFNEHRTAEIIKERILAGANVALISDAGTPGISDPGFLLARTCANEGIEVQTLPGATAFVPALVSSGIPCDRFCFEGFLPVRKGRQTRLQELSSEVRTMVFYESPYRLVKTLDQFAEVFGPDRMCSVAREISKKFEEHRRGPVREVADWYREHEPKGEIVIIIAGLQSI